MSAAHRLAMASDFIRADMVETSEFPDIVKKYGVDGVPHTVINEDYAFIGPLSPLETLYEVFRAVGIPAPPRKEEHEHEGSGLVEHKAVHQAEPVHHHEHEKPE